MFFRSDVTQRAEPSTLALSWLVSLSGAACHHVATVYWKRCSARRQITSEPHHAGALDRARPLLLTLRSASSVLLVIALCTGVKLSHASSSVCRKSERVS